MLARFVRIVDMEEYFMLCAYEGIRPIPCDLTVFYVWRFRRLPDGSKA